MIRAFKPNEQDKAFYSDMGAYFASLDIAKELERQVYNKPDTVWYVAYSDSGDVAGFASVHEGTTRYFLDNLYVFPKERGAGIAQALVDAAIKDSFDKPLKCIACNPYALRIFGKSGFIGDGMNGKYQRLVKY